MSVKLASSPRKRSTASARFANNVARAASGSIRSEYDETQSGQGNPLQQRRFVRDAEQVDEVEIVVAHSERTTLKVGSTFLKVDADPARLEREAQAMSLAPIRTAEILWHQPPVLALAELPGTPLGRLGDASSRSSAAWVATGAALREWSPVFIHGDLQIAHVLLDENDAVTGVLDWSEAAQGDPLSDLATLTLGHPEHLDDPVAGYGSPLDLDVIRAWWSVRSLLAARWLIEHGFDPDAPGCEFDVLRSQV